MYCILLVGIRLALYQTLVGLDQIDQRMLRLPWIYYNISRLLSIPGIFRILAHRARDVGGVQGISIYRRTNLSNVL